MGARRKHRTHREARLRERTGDPLVRAMLDAAQAVRRIGDDLADEALVRRHQLECVTFEPEQQHGGPTRGCGGSR